jgi:uncharacterized protein (DUF1330 family)
MRSRYGLALAVLAGAVLGMVVDHNLKAQSSPPVYVISELTVTDQDRFTKEYGPKVEPTFAPFSGHYVVRGGNTVTFAGDPPKRIVVIAFDNMEKAKSWQASPAYQALVPLRDQVTKIRSFAVEAVPK